MRELTVAPVLYPMNCIDLSLTEILSDPDGVHKPGDLVTWTLTPHNDGPRAAPAGWTITQLLPDGVELVSISGDGYDVAGATATGIAELAAGADGSPLTVTVRVVDPPPGQSTLRNVAYVSPAPDTDLDGDGFADAILEQLSPLAVPTLATDTSATATDNDAQGVWITVADSGPGPGPEPSGGDASSSLPGTGLDVLSPLIACAALLLLGTGLTASARRRRS